MIRINLLSVREVRAEVGRRMEFVVAGLSLAVTVLLMLVVFLYQFYRSLSVGGELAALRADIAGMEAQVKEVAELQKKVADLTQKNKVIEDLTKKKAGPVRGLESLSSAMPSKASDSRMKRFFSLLFGIKIGASKPACSATSSRGMQSCIQW
jgi:Tfp pilus assembly protein PilN